MMRSRTPRPYVMRGRAVPASRPTVDDARDVRVSRAPQRQLSPQEVHAIMRPGATDPRLRPADRWLERWGATHGGGSMLPFIASVTLVARKSLTGVPELDDRESLAVDAVVHSSPNWARTFAMLWYRSDCSVQQIAQLLRIRRVRAVYEERELVLGYYLGRFSEIGLKITYWVETG